MSKKKKIVLIVVIVAMLAVAAVIAVKRVSMHGKCGENLTWEYDGKGTLTISGTGAMSDWDTTDNCPGWYDYREEITTVIVSEGVTSIGDFAFYGANRGNSYRLIEKVELPDSLRSIGNSAFSGSGITKIQIPDGVVSIGFGAFLQCEKLKQISIPGSVRSIERYSFSYCTNLEEIELSEGLAVIESSAFYDCTELAEITIPETVNEIEGFAFCGCAELSRITFLGSMPFELETDDEGAYEFHNAFLGVTATAYWPENNDTWIGFPTAYLGGDIEWIPYD